MVKSFCIVLVIVIVIAAHTRCECSSIGVENPSVPTHVGEGDLGTGGCPSWLFNKKKAPPGLKCESNEALLLVGYCATYQNTLNYTAVGKFAFNYRYVVEQVYSAGVKHKKSINL